MSIERYDWQRERWRQTARMNGRRVQFGVAVLDGKVYVVGGRDGLRTLHTVECWDPVTGLWHKLPCMMTPRHGLGQ